VKKEKCGQHGRERARPWKKSSGISPAWPSRGLAQSRPAHLKLEIKGQKENAGHEARRL
jgi:hypothetical protein